MTERMNRIPAVAKNATTGPSTAESTGRRELIRYAKDGGKAVFLRAEGGTVGFAQTELADLFQSTKQDINLHIKNILDESELEEVATVKESLTVQTEGKRKVRRRKDCRRDLRG